MSTSPVTPPPNTSNSRKPRSPAAPSHTLEECLGDVRKLYDAYGRAAFSQAEFASTLGISASSGPTAARLFTLKEYGLLAKDSSNLKITEDYIVLKAIEPGTAEFKRTAYAAVVRSSLFKDLLSAFGSKLPSQATVATRLEGQMKFNFERAKAIAEILDKSLRFAGVVDANGNIVPAREETSKRAEPKPTEEGGEEELATEDTVVLQRKDSLQPQALRIEVPLKDGRRVLVSYPPDLTDEEAKKIGSVLAAIAS